MKRILLALAILVAAAVTAPIVSSAAEVTSLRGPNAIDEPNKAPMLAPINEKGKISRNYRQQPPMIPHRIDKYEIDNKINQCLRCHDWFNAAKENATPISQTHYVDRNGVSLEKVAPRRWFCNQCHAPQVDAQPLVENTFKPSVQ